MVQKEDDGFTLIELLVGMVVFGVIASLGTSGWLSYQRAVEHRGSSHEIVSALRSAQQASLAEAVTYCVRFDAASRSYRIFKFSCDASGTPVKPEMRTQSERVELLTPQFVQSDGSTTDHVTFHPRGAASPGNVKVARSDSDKAYTISVEGLTGRVSLTG